MRIPWCIAVVLASCGSPAREPVAVVTPPPPTTNPPASTTSEPIPLGRLPTDVRPVSESLILTVDPERDGFSGTAEIVVELSVPRDQIWLHGRGLKVQRITANGAKAQWQEVDPVGVARVTLPAQLSGTVALHIEYSAAYDPSLVGVYRTRTAVGPAVFSKFEAIYARRAFPCFDEPAFKIPYDVTIIAPAAAHVVGNMPIARDEAGGETHRVTFQRTPPLPSYLVAFAVGPFETRTTSVAPSPYRKNPLPVGAVALTGRGRDTAFALAVEPALLAWQERYFEVEFPYPKLDLIAVPDFQSGAMENAGAITFRDSLLLVDDKVTPLRTRLGVASVIAHETAHQWFGDLVTMPWWDDLWLNEGFATFLATRTLRAVRPADEAELEAANSLEEVMMVDGLASARRIRQPIASSHDITNAFDGITYKKGAAVLAMVEHYVGEEPFRQGLHAHLEAHALGNATTEDLLRALSTATGKQLAPMVGSFVDQPGVPVVTAKAQCTGKRGSVALAQERWRAIGATTEKAKWTIPVCVRAGIGKRVERACTVLDGETGTLELPGCADWVLPNADAAGYYRSALPAEDLGKLRDRGVAQLSTVERISVGHDLEAAFASGKLSTAELLRALEPLARDAHGAVAIIPLEIMQDLDERFARGKARGKLRERIAKLYGPIADRLGWKPARGEAGQRRLFRMRVLDTLALDLDQPRAFAAAANHGKRLLGLGADRQRHPDEVEPELVEVALAAAARTGEPAVLDTLIADLVASSDAQVRSQILLALGHVRAPADVQRVLALSLDPRLRQNERTMSLKLLARDPQTRDDAWAWLNANFERLTPLLPDRFGGQLPGMFRVCDKAWRDRLQTYFEPRMEQLTGGPRNLAQTLELADQCVALVGEQQAGFDATLGKP